MGYRGLLTYLLSPPDPPSSLRSLQRGCKDLLQGPVFYESLAGSTRVSGSEMTSRLRACRLGM